MKIPIGIDKNTSKVILIEDLTEEQRGLKSNCICPECKSDLVARMGEKTVWHFAHYKGNESRNCQETALHLLGKYVLSQLTSIKIIDFETQKHSKQDMLGREYSIDSSSLFGTKNVELISSELEKTIGDIRADVLSQATYENINLEINFEIKVWHRVDERKEKKVNNLSLNTIEIDISGLLSENTVGFKEVKDELEKPYNQTIIHLNEQFLSEVNKAAIDKLNMDVELINQTFCNWINSTAEYFKLSGIQLPPYSYRFHNLPDNKFGEIIKSKFPQPPKTNSFIKVLSFEYLQGLRFELVAGNESNKKVLPVILSEDYQDLNDEELSEEPNFLVFDIEQINRLNNQIVCRWGRNQLAEDYIKACNQIIIKNLAERKVYEEKQLLQNLTEAQRLIESGETKVNANYQNIKKLSVMYYREMISKGINADLLNSLVIEDIDPHRIFGCQPKLWQMILIRDICWVNNNGVDVAFSTKRLEKLGVQVVDPYRQLMFKSKLMKQKFLEMPFTTPYKMLIGYFEYLSMKGFIVKEWGGKYMKTLPFGKEYRQAKKEVMNG